MFYLYLLPTLALLVAALFLSPLRSKVWVALASVVTMALAAAIPAIGVLSSTKSLTIMEFTSPIFGQESLSIDPLSPCSC